MNRKLSERRMGDQIAIPGDYQYRVLQEGIAPQRFWHWAKLIEAERWIQPRPGDAIIDVGCGSGVLAAQLAEYPKVEVMGIDSNDSAISFAQGRFRKSNLSFRLGFLDEMDLINESVSKIAFLEVIEHIYERQAMFTFQEFFRVLRPGGRLVITTPNSRSLWPLIEWMLDRLNLVPHMAEDQHITLYNADTLIRMGRSVGFNLITCRSLNGLAPWLAFLNWKLAFRMHQLEQLRPQMLGSLLLLCFEKS